MTSNKIVIHLISTLDRKEWHPLWEHCYQIWLTSPYSIKLWGIEEINKELINDDPNFLNILNTLPEIYKIDYVRYHILENYGGAYFDLDIEIVKDFLYMLNPNKIYLMGGRLNEYVSNSIMINLSPTKIIRDWVWASLKSKCKFNILNNLKDAQIPNNVINLAGPIFLSNFFSLLPKDLKKNNIEYELLSPKHFDSLTNEISFCRHYNLATWEK